MGYLEKFLIHHRRIEIMDLEVDIRTAQKAGRLGTAFRKFNFLATRKMSNTEYAAFLEKKVTTRKEEIEALERFRDLR